MTLTRTSDFLRRVLLADAAMSGAAALLLIVGASMLEPILGLPASLMLYAGLLLVPFVAFVAFTAIREPIARAAVWTVVAANAAWVAGSILVLASGRLSPTLLGYAFVLVQTAAVAGMAELQRIGLRRQTAAAT